MLQGCGTWFCSFCAEPFGKGRNGDHAASEHARGCAGNTVAAGEAGAPRRTFLLGQQSRRERALQAFVDRIHPDLRTELLEKLRTTDECRRESEESIVDADAG